ncbi:MAG: hypothetical protein JXQ93_03345 [Flavobacteriaceae bacterium]
MIKFEDPWQLVTKKKINNNIIEYFDLMELSQGGPEIGLLCINGKIINKHRFGGPFLSDNNYIYIPIYIKNFFSSGFKICKLGINDFEVKVISKKEDLIFLDKLDNSILYYFTDRNKVNLKSIKI